MSTKLNDDVNIIANSNLGITYFDGNVNIIQELDDEPNDVGGLTSAELKAKFDEGANIIKKFINESLIPEVLAEEATEAARAEAEAARNVWEAYDDTKNYVRGNKVSYKGSSYVNTSACTGVAPTDETCWLLIAEKGERGDMGFQGPEGKQGPKGDPGIGIAGIENTYETNESGGRNEFAVVLQDGSRFPFHVYNGQQGPEGQRGPMGWEGPEGKQGPKGERGIGIVGITRTYETDESGARNEFTVDLQDGSRHPVYVWNGAEGQPGPAGHTPVRGTDYWTPEDRKAIVTEVLEEVGGDVIPVTDLSAAVRQVVEGDPAAFNAHNGSMILCSTTPNDAVFTDRTDATRYLIPVPANADKITVETTDESVTLLQFIGVKVSDGAYTKVFETERGAARFCEFEKNTADYIAINLIYEDTGAVTVPWDYDVTATTAVTFSAAESAGVRSWNDLTGKPFGEEAVTVFDQTLQYAQTDSDGDGVNDSWDNAAVVIDTSDKTLIVGEIYRVTWNGTVYELECKASGQFGGLPAIGNAAVFGGESDGIPFIIGRDIANVMGNGQCWAVLDFSLLEDTDLTDSGIRTCKVECIIVNTLDVKYLPMNEIAAYIDNYINEALGGEY